MFALLTYQEMPFASCLAGALNRIAKLETALNDPQPPHRGATIGGGGQAFDANAPYIVVMVGIKPLPLLTDKQKTNQTK